MAVKEQRAQDRKPCWHVKAAFARYFREPTAEEKAMSAEYLALGVYACLKGFSQSPALLFLPALLPLALALPLSPPSVPPVACIRRACALTV
jgi:hypothetical protein